ncbi:MAG: DUF5686 and carboxypeptidase regulatory-like domain-containing protein [Saprospiraceae bacterium]
MNFLPLRISLLVLFYGFVTVCYAGGIRGKVTDVKGEPLPYATIYVVQSKTGTTTNLEGFFEINLSPGSYDLSFQYLGYESVQKRVVISSDFTTLDIRLTQREVDLDVLEVYDGRENPSYTIMRKAIGKSKYHLNQLDSYSTEVYVKGTGRIKKIPWLLRRSLAKDGVDTKTAFVSESVSEVSYKRPNYFSEKVISRRTKGDSNETDPGGFINGSFYLPKVEGAISPFSTKAFAYYRFEFLGSFFDQGREINRIKVIPRSPGELVFTGTVNIVDGIWAIHSLDLSMRKEGFDVGVKQMYSAIQENVWLPVSHRFKIEGTILGIVFEYNYLATNGKYEITLNPDLDVAITVIDEKIEVEKAKTLSVAAKKLEVSDINERLSEGKELTKKDLEKILKDYEKEEKEESETPTIVRIENFTVDSLADSRDSAYWSEVRPMPLDNYEIRGYEVQDSIRIVDGDDAVAFGSSKFKWTDILFGGTYFTEKYGAKINAPLSSLNFNTVEGFHFDYGLEMTKYGKNRFHTTVGLTTRYAFNRDRLNGKAFVELEFGERLKRGKFNVEGGRYISQINDEDPIHPLVNTLYTLLLEENYMKIYEKDFAKLAYEQQVLPNVKVELGVEWANRFLLENSTSNQKWVDREKVSYSSNLPFFAEDYGFDASPTRNTKATIATLGLEYKPWQKYKIYNGKKQALSKRTPTFSLKYRKGIAGVLESDVEFDHLEFGFRHDFVIGADDYLQIKADAGGFFNDKNMDIIDYKHFPGNRTLFSTLDPIKNFRLLDYYAYSTKDAYWNAHLQYDFRKLLFTRIKLVHILGIRENLFFSHLNTDGKNNYSEIGYNIDRIFRIFRLEFVTSFKEFEYADFGVRIGIRTFIGDRD